MRNPRLEAVQEKYEDLIKSIVTGVSENQSILLRIIKV